MTPDYHGSCHCGRVQFTWSGAPRFVGECVCASCRRTHGASVVGWLGGPAGQFKLLSGEVSLKWYRSSAASERGFCKECGTRLLFRSTQWPGEIHLALACMHEPHDLISKGVAFPDELPGWTVMHERPEG